MKKLLLGILLLSSFNLFSQQKREHTSEDLIFENENTDFSFENTFDGILNYELHKRISSNEKLNFSQSWDNEQCFSSRRRNNPNALEDTLWLCVGDTMMKEFKVPYDGYVTSRFGPRHGRPHQGIDISLKTGDLVSSAWSGRVRYAKFNKGGYGNLVVVRHYNGLETFYAHLSKILVVPNQEVKAGELIGLGGNTGRSFGAHLHFEIRFYDMPINPDYIIDFANKNVRDENLLVHRDLFKSNRSININSKSKESELDEEEFMDHDHSIDAAEMMAGVALPVASDLKPTKPVAPREFRKYHRVRSGDTLSKIARQNNTTIDKLCQLNGIRAGKTLDIGDSIRIK